MSKYENLSTEEMAEKYKNLKDNERIRNKKCYDKMKADFPEKYKLRLQKNREYIDQYLDNIKQNEEKLDIIDIIDKNRLNIEKIEPQIIYNYLYIFYYHIFDYLNSKTHMYNNLIIFIEV